MSKEKLSKDEWELVRAAESGEFESTLTAERRMELEAAAANTFRKDGRINIRLSNRDLIAVKAKAAEDGIPYQTLVSSIIHKYVSGSLVDITANKKRLSDP
ncbi:MAG: hypothetical protein OEU52_17845 [Xanthomonadales bacterium]|nr:hypothetical protein [Xanthomonadales bacterium]